MTGPAMMRQTVARKLGLDIAALTRDPASGQQLPGLVPTLFVGVGGSGAKILQRVKKRLRLGQPEEYSFASFLVIDTDASTLVGLAPLFGPQEVVGCPLPVEPGGADPSAMLPVRARGHEAYVANYEAIDRALALAYRRVPPPDWRGAAEGPRLHPERTAIVIVGSLWGVTGSGMVLDVAYHLGRMAPHAWKAAYLLLPGAYDPLAEQEDPSLAFANAYAALSEINYLSTIDPATGAEGTLWVDGPGGVPLKYQGAPWERCYLVEGANSDNVAQLYEANCAMVADSLFWDMTLVLGAWKWALRDRLGYAAARTGGGPFASFGMAALRFPRERVIAHCSRRFTDQLLARWIGQAAPVGEAKARPSRSEADVFVEQHPEWKSSGLVKRLSKLKGKGSTSIDVAISDWSRPLANESEVKKHGRNVATVLLKEWQRMEICHWSPKADADGWGPRIDANVGYRAAKYREALEEAIHKRLEYDAQGWQGLQGVMNLLEELGKKVAGYGPRYEEALPKLKKAVAERKEDVMAAYEELSKLCSNPITFPFSGAKVQAAAGSFAASAQAHLQAHLELRATMAAMRLARKIVEECRAAFERLASARDVIAQARAMIRQQEDPEPVVGDVFRPEAIDELFARAFPPETPAPAGSPTKKLHSEPSPFQLASKRIAVELGCDSLPALLERIREGEVMAGTLAEIAIEEGRRAFAPFASSIDFVDHYRRTFPAPEEQALGLAETYFRAAPYVRFAQATPAGVVIGVNGMAFTEEGYKAIGPLLQAVPLKETEVGLVPLQEGEDEGVVYYREVAGLHITSLPAISEAQPCYDWIMSQGIAGLHISRPVEEAPGQESVQDPTTEAVPEPLQEPAPEAVGAPVEQTAGHAMGTLAVGDGVGIGGAAFSADPGGMEPAAPGQPPLPDAMSVIPKSSMELEGAAGMPGPEALMEGQVDGESTEAAISAALRENGATHPDASPVETSGGRREGGNGPGQADPDAGRSLGGNAAALQVGVDDTPFEIHLDPAALGEDGASQEGTGFSFDPFK